MPTAVVGLMTGLLTHVFAMSGEKYVYKYNDVVVACRPLRYFSTSRKQYDN